MNELQFCELKNSETYSTLDDQYIVRAEILDQMKS